MGFGTSQTGINHERSNQQTTNVFKRRYYVNRQIQQVRPVRRNWRLKQPL